MGLIALQKTSSTQCTIPLTDFVIQRFDTEQLYNITLYSFGVAGNWKRPNVNLKSSGFILLLWEEILQLQLK